MQNEETKLHKIEDPLHKDRRSFGVGLWFAISILVVAILIFFLLSKLLGLIFAFSVPSWLLHFTRQDRNRLEIWVRKLLHYRCYDSLGKESRRRRFLVWFGV